MAQATGTFGAKDHQQQHEHNIGDDEVSELHKSRNFYDKVREQAERFASTRLGQFVIARGDRALRMIEITAKWSLPQEKNAAPLERPLPWMAFLMLIILLRVTRMWLSMGALMIGNGPVSPTDMIYFIQTRRRKLRAIRLHGLKVMRQREQELQYGAGKGLTYKISQWLSRAICRPGVQRANSGRLFTVNSNSLEQNVSKRPREEESQTEADHNLTIDEMLAKYANVNSEDDSDFVPNAAGESSDDSSEESSDNSKSNPSSSSSEEETDVVDDMKAKPLAMNGVHGDKEKHANATKPTTTIITSNGDKEHQQTTTEVVQQEEQKPLAAPKEEKENHKELKDQPLKTTRLYNNTAAAANVDPDPDIQPQNPNDPVTESQAPFEDTVNCSSSCVSIVNQDNQQDTQTEELKTQTSNPNHPIVDTLTPATSSEDIFYSPIGSPTTFNTTLGPQIKSAIIQFGLAHSTPTIDMEDYHCEASELESAVLANISQAHEIESQRQDAQSIKEPQKQPQIQQQQQQQHPRQHNHPHQRYRGRNRR
ncbi:RNA polymerase II degradation factor 1 isoform X2 [Drosophila willistoni]|uniref:RNA polymerase II degradation factor 1 isoform X2 n=1 Tax=Drosophila willistoni TaxID=7260 RepID=UPI000C26D76F|nr:RNA polymerase II degradation factor 1 isoform X2 [Drosophila willistoni]